MRINSHLVLGSAVAVMACWSCGGGTGTGGNAGGTTHVGGGSSNGGSSESSNSGASSSESVKSSSSESTSVSSTSSGSVSVSSTSSTSGKSSSAGSTSSASSRSASSSTSFSSSSSSGVTGPWPPTANYSNPVLWEDLPDDEVIRVDDVFYYTASNMHYSPGAPILRSWDLVNWEFAGHAVPVLDFSAKYDLSGGQAYIKGTWASSLHYRKSNKTFYWMGCIEFGKTYVYTSSAVDSTWTKHPAINNCYYDCGMMVDYDDSPDDTMYVAYGGGGNISVAQLSSDYLSQVKTQQVYTTNGAYTLEGSHFFKYKGNYYITPTRPANGEFILKASSPFGPYTIKTLIDGGSGPIAGGGTPHQGSFIQTQNGDWYYMAFQDAYPGSRVPVLAPVTWSADGWPTVTLVNGAFGASYPYPNVPRPPQATKPLTGTDTFAGTKLSPEWEWNHNPDNTKWSINNGVTLQTATVTTDLYAARNTLTRRSLGPQSTGTIKIDVSGMKAGDVAGLALLRQASAYIAIKKSATGTTISMVQGLSMDTSTWNTTSTGTEAASSPFSGNVIWLRASLDIRPGSGRQGKFSYSTDGTTFTSLGSALPLNNSWEFFPGYRYGIFNFATQALGGSIKLSSFTLTAP